ncbi:MAG: hypothetical protein EAZ49_12870 [Oscillatoriales cyanobacterium]|nr:MAG: hypothetical protein EAZ49_12870 [Oscillatoriales cyanobacterium]TAG70488.1 MAG: hypothetical protein EAZ23_22540 [Oscillatoriales cyanobacterium]
MKQDPLLSGPAQLFAKAARGTDIRVARMENVAPKIVSFAVFLDIFRLSLDVVDTDFDGFARERNRSDRAF